ncbi:MAG: hypothetical protein RL309_1620 [Verrucomicrobiota bacterium]
MQCVNDTDAAAGRDAGDGLREIEVRIHAQLGIQEEHPKQLRGLHGILVVTRDLISGGQSGDGITH